MFIKEREDTLILKQEENNRKCFRRRATSPNIVMERVENQNLDFSFEQ